MALRQGATVKELNTPTGSNFTLAELEAGVQEHKPDMLFVTHGESSTGVVQPLEGVGSCSICISLFEGVGDNLDYFL